MIRHIHAVSQQWGPLAARERWRCQAWQCLNHVCERSGADLYWVGGACRKVSKRVLDVKWEQKKKRLGERKSLPNVKLCFFFAWIQALTERFWFCTLTFVWRWHLIWISIFKLWLEKDYPFVFGSIIKCLVPALQYTISDRELLPPPSMWVCVCLVTLQWQTFVLVKRQRRNCCFCLGVNHFFLFTEVHGQPKLLFMRTIA